MLIKQEDDMLDFEAVRCKKLTVNELAASLSKEDLRRLTNEMVDAMEALIANCVDADVTFEPQDPTADDPHAATPEEKNMPWTLGHVIVHTTASAEEAAAVAAEMARGVAYHGRSRAETHWTRVKTIAQCRARFAESRRMRLASLDMWPDQPDLEIMAEIIPGRPPVNAQGRFVMGLMHDDAHLPQIAEVARQAKAKRS
jgi:hypothetical protein